MFRDNLLVSSSRCFWPSRQQYPEDGEKIIPWKVEEPSNFDAAVCLRTFHWNLSPPKPQDLSNCHLRTSATKHTVTLTSCQRRSNASFTQLAKPNTCIMRYFEKSNVEFLKLSSFFFFWSSKVFIAKSSVLWFIQLYTLIARVPNNAGKRLLNLRRT
jgi:hypothetical protein